MMPDLSVTILHSGGHYPELVEEYLSREGGPVTSAQVRVDDFEAIDSAASVLPSGFDQAEVLIAIALPDGILAALPPLLADTPCRALLVPVEDPSWVRPGLERQLQGLCRSAGLECAVPMPFCSLTGTGDVISRFCEQYRAGRPRVELELSDDVVTEVRCLRSTPCGLTLWLAEQIGGTPVDKLLERAQTLHHARPCMASMALVRDLGDTLMHVSLDILKRAFSSALRRAQGGSVIRMGP